MPRLERAAFVATAVAALVFLYQAAWLEAKAVLAQQLIAAAWQRTLAGDTAVTPWPWADTWPVARLTTPTGRHLYVLDSVSGQALAFGPGRLRAGAEAGGRGTTVIAGHRDTHFHFLQHVAAGDRFILQNASGEETAYTVTGSAVVDSRVESLQLQHQHPELLLISCYPFNTIETGGPLRYLVSARVANNAA